MYQNELKKIYLSGVEFLNYICKDSTRNITINEDDKQRLIKFFNKGNGITQHKNIYRIYGKTREYRCIKISNNIFKIVVYLVSNKKNTSEPIQEYYLH